MKCPACEAPMVDGFVYVRGVGSSLHWSTRSDVPFHSRSDLELMDLREMSLRPPRAQAVVPAGRCPGCRTIALLPQSNA